MTQDIPNFAPLTIDEVIDYADDPSHIAHDVRRWYDETNSARAQEKRIWQAEPIEIGGEIVKPGDVVNLVMKAYSSSKPKRILNCVIIGRDIETAWNGRYARLRYVSFGGKIDAGHWPRVDVHGMNKIVGFERIDLDINPKVKAAVTGWRKSLAEGSPMHLAEHEA